MAKRELSDILFGGDNFKIKPLANMTNREVQGIRARIKKGMTGLDINNRNKSLRFPIGTG
jgi:hypothetical protein